jgi:hypothetical protein
VAERAPGDGLQRLAGQDRLIKLVLDSEALSGLMGLILQPLVPGYVTQQPAQPAQATFPAVNRGHAERGCKRRAPMGF